MKKQIEMYHQGFEPQENGTFIPEAEPTLQRNAELAYLEAEYQRKLEIQRAAENQTRENRRRNSYYSR